jgi:cytoskeletal protein RodZ
MKDPEYAKAAGPRLYQTLAADGAATGGDQLSLSRKLFVLLLASLLLIAAPLAWASSAAGAKGPDDAPQAVLVKSQDDDDDDQDEDDDETDTDDEEATGGDDSDTGTGTGKQTRGDTSESSDDKTGRETQAKNTDRAGNHTGVSTRGETDPGDKTGKTERR